MKRRTTPILDNKSIERKWHLIDARSDTFGRVASRVAGLLIGKQKVSYTQHQDLGDFVVITNVDKIKVTGAKALEKKYYRHSWYPGSIKEETLGERKKRQPERLFFDAVRLMLPKNSLSKKRLKRLKLYKGEVHPHQEHFPKSDSQKKDSK